ncbi:MAG: PAS domain S-box protein [Methanomicrobiales archaeon]
MYLEKNQNLQTIIIILAAISFILAELVIYFVAGQTNLIITNLFYIPVILFAFRYPRYGVLTGLIFGACYLLLVSYITYPSTTELIPSFMQFYVFITISVIISSVLTRTSLNQAKYESIFKFSGNAICLVDKKSHTIVEMNPGFHALLIIPKEAAISRSIDDYFPDQEFRELIFENLERQHSVENVEGRVQKTDGTLVSVLLNARNFEDYNLILINLTDITKPETALKISENRYRTLVETAQEGIWVVDHDGLTRYTNPKMTEMLGYSETEMKGKTYFDFMDTTDRQAAGDMIAAGGNAGQIQDREFAFTRKDGSRILTRFTTSPIMDMDNSPAGELALVSDISTIKEHEKELKSSLEEKSVLIMEIHHRVKNNLQIISGLIRLQSRYITNEQAVYALRQCEARIGTMALVHESLYQSGSPANINARSHITKLGNMLLLSHEYGSKIRMAFDVDDIPIDMNLAVPASLVINELVLNSIKYAFPGKDQGTIRISLHQEPDNQLSLAIGDDGIGLPEEFDIKEINTLGLKLVTRLVRDQLKGTIDIKRHKGTEFIIRFPHVVSGEQGTGGKKDV